MLEADPEIELMLLDINMPIMDGLTVLSHLHDRQSAIKAIIVSQGDYRLGIWRHGKPANGDEPGRL